MNRHGEVERAIARARIGAELYRLVGAIVRRAGNTTGEITAEYAPRLATLFAEAKLSTSAGYRALGDGDRLSWIVRYETDDSAKFAGRVIAGRDDDRIAECEWCGKSLSGMRPHARYCSDRCRKRVVRLSGRSLEPGQQAVPENPDTVVSGNSVRHEPGQCPTSTRTDFPENPDKVQVRPRVVSTADKESSEEKREWEHVFKISNDSEGPCAVCGRACVRYGPAGGPLCESCAALPFEKRLALVTGPRTRVE